MTVVKPDDGDIHRTRSETLRQLKTRAEAPKARPTRATEREIAAHSGARLLSHFGNRLKEAINAKGLTISEVADEIGITRQTMTNWIGRANPPRGETARRQIVQMATVVERSPDWLLYAKGEKLAAERNALKIESGDISPDAKEVLAELERLTLDWHLRIRKLRDPKS